MGNFMQSPMPAVCKARQCASADCKMRRWITVFSAIAILTTAPAFALDQNATKPESTKDFYITVTANGLYLCGEGFGGLYGCIDEALSREVQSVVISASENCSVAEVQELINAVHAAGFSQVGVASFSEPDI